VTESDSKIKSDKKWAFTPFSCFIKIVKETTLNSWHHHIIAVVLVCTAHVCDTLLWCWCAQHMFVTPSKF
jgi:hypothetical protein